MEEKHYYKHSFEELISLMDNDFKSKNLHKVEYNSELLIECRLKFINSCNELASAILHKNDDKIKESIGDVFNSILVLNIQRGREAGSFYIPNILINERPEVIVIDYLLTADYPINIFFLDKICKALSVSPIECLNIHYNKLTM